jgi:hypothetical protein
VEQWVLYREDPCRLLLIADPFWVLHKVCLVVLSPIWVIWQAEIQFPEQHSALAMTVVKDDGWRGRSGELKGTTLLVLFMVHRVCSVHLKTPNQTVPITYIPNNDAIRGFTRSS